MRSRLSGAGALALGSLIAIGISFMLMGDSETDSWSHPAKLSPKASPATPNVSSPPRVDGPKAGLRPGSLLDVDLRADLDEEHGDAGFDAERWKYADIEDLKAAIYEREIDTVDALYKLDEFVQTGDMDTRELWDTDWAGVDDWKRHEDGFNLSRADDGTLLFVPGEETMRTYTFLEEIGVYEYDEKNTMFVSRVDYYGKPIVNVVKFLREDVLVMMTISGYKVDLNIYENGSTP